jgi:tRNA G46 methylase TrmB
LTPPIACGKLPRATMPHRRNAYADRLNDEFGDFAFGDDAVFARPGRWREFFHERIGRGFADRVVFEIGCADASLLARVAAKYSATAFVGLDWKPRTIYDAAARVAASRLHNVALLRGRAQDVRQIFGDGELDEVWLFHPDPCDKPDELRNRLLSEPFLLDVHAVMRRGASAALCLKTDHPGYYQWTLSLLGMPEPEALRSHPRVKSRELMRSEDVPPASAAARGRFDVAIHSPDFWNDPAALARTSARAFAGEITGFEDRFRSKRRPIYYVELALRADGSGSDGTPMA